MKDSSVCCAAHEFDRQGEGRGVEGERERGREGETSASSGGHRKSAKSVIYLEDTRVVLS